MELIMTLFTLICILWFVSELFLNRFLRSKNSSSKYDGGTLRIIWITIMIAMFVGVTFSNIYRIPMTNSSIIQYIGLLLIVFGMLFRFISIWTLGKFFTVDIAIATDHKIKTDGLYKFIRHPSYSGALLSFVGFGLSLNNWVSLLIIVVPVTWSFIHRIKAEEKMLIDQFGNNYLEYMNNTKRLLPFVY